jgi:hypothetical protein
MSTSLFYHALGIRDYGQTDHFASNGRRLAASTARGSVARVRTWPWFTPFRPCRDPSMGRKQGFTGRTPAAKVFCRTCLPTLTSLAMSIPTEYSTSQLRPNRKEPRDHNASKENACPR